MPLTGKPHRNGAPSENKPCICPNTGCPAHGNCRECKAFHRGKPYCTSEETKKLVEGNLKKYGIMGK